MLRTPVCPKKEEEGGISQKIFEKDVGVGGGGDLL